MSFLIWSLWLGVLSDGLYAVMDELADVSPEGCSAMNAGFDAEHRRLFPDFYLE